MAPPSLNAGLVRSIAVSTPLGSSLGPAGASWGPPPHEGRKTMISTSSVALYVALPSFSGSSVLDDTRLASSLRLEHAVPVHRAGVGIAAHLWRDLTCAPGCLGRRSRRCRPRRRARSSPAVHRCRSIGLA